MYGKIFDTIYNGTLYGHWEAMVTMQQLIVLADADGIVDMTPMAISARTSIPRDIIDKGLEILGSPDKYTRTPGSDGRRIELIDEHRPWGWILVNYEKYKTMVDADTVRAQTRERVRKYRENKKKSKDVTDVTVGNGRKRHIDIDIDTDKSSTAKSGFADFWKAYPVKRDKRKAESAWRTKKLESRSAELIADVENRKQNDAQWIDGYIPHPTTYINGERWEDEIVAPKKSGGKVDIMALAKSKGVEPRPGESMDEFTRRVQQTR